MSLYPNLSGLSGSEKAKLERWLDQYEWFLTIASIKEERAQEIPASEDEAEKKTLLQKSGELIGDILGSQFETVGTETEVELNFAMVKIRHKVIRGNKEDKK